MDYLKYLNPEVTAIPPSGIRKFFDIANTMEGVISLGVGEPDFVTPWKIRKAGISSLENGQTRYTANRGLSALRQEISAYLKRKYDLSYESDGEVLVTIGGSEAIDAVIRALVCPGEEVLIPQPSFVLSVMEESSSSGVSLNSFSALVSMMTGTPPASLVIGS